MGTDMNKNLFQSKVVVYLNYCNFT